MIQSYQTDILLTMTIKLFLFPLKHLHIHIYITNNGNMEKSGSHGFICLTFPVFHQHITAALNQLIESIISKYEYS